MSEGKFSMTIALILLILVVSVPCLQGKPVRAYSHERDFSYAWSGDVDLPSKLAADAVTHLISDGLYAAGQPTFSGGEVIQITTSARSSRFVDYLAQLISEGVYTELEYIDALQVGAQQVSDAVVSDGFSRVECSILYGAESDLNEKQQLILDLTQDFKDSLFTAITDDTGNIRTTAAGEKVIDALAALETLGEISAYISYLCFAPTVVGYDYDSDLGIDGSERVAFWDAVNALDLYSASTEPSYTSGVFDLNGWDELGARQDEIRPVDVEGYQYGDSSYSSFVSIYGSLVSDTISMWVTKVEDGTLTTADLSTEEYVLRYSIGMLVSRMNYILSNLDALLEKGLELAKPDTSDNYLAVSVAALVLIFVFASAAMGIVDFIHEKFLKTKGGS